MDYAKGKIYSIRSYQTDKFYIGSTASPLSKRFYEHKATNKKFIAGTLKGSCSSFQILNFGDAYIELLEEYPCENKNQLRKREGEYIRDNDCVNKVIIGRTQVEYRQDNKEQIKEKKKEYREQNKEKILENKAEWRQDNKDKINEKFVCECGGRYTHQHKARHFNSLKHLKFVQVCVPQQDEGQKIGTENI